MIMQLPLFNKWIDGRRSEPEDGQQVLAYNWIENPDDEMEMFKKHHIEYAGHDYFGARSAALRKKVCR